jgi:hypothetical protein
MRLETAAPIALDQWQHVLMTYDGKRKASGVRIYINGQSQPIVVLFDELTYPLNNAEPFRIGAGEGPQNRFQGIIDEVRVSKALSVEEAIVLPVQEASARLRLAQRCEHCLKPTSCDSVFSKNMLQCNPHEAVVPV